MDTIGKRIQYLLKKEFLTSNELSKYLDIPLSFLTAIIRDETEPELSTAILIAEYFGIPLDWFVTGRGHIERHEEYNQRPHILTKDKDVQGNIQIDITDSIDLPSGKKVDERRADFKSPFVKEILASIKKLTSEQRQKVLQIINLTFDLEQN